MKSQPKATGKNVQINERVGTQHNHYYGTVPTLPPSDEALRAVFAGYCKSLAEQCKNVNVVGLNIAAERGQRAPGLDVVYVALETSSHLPGDKGKEVGSRALSAWDALFLPDAKKAVFTGEPGSGKSTFVQHVALRLAGEEKGPVPFRIVLRHFERDLAPEAKGTAAEVLAWLKAQLAKACHTAAEQHLEDLLQRGAAVVFFDGLDEVPQLRLPVIREAIRSFATGGFAKSRIVVTCRIASYEQTGMPIPGFPDPHQLIPLSDALQQRFIAAWYQESKDCGFLKTDAEQEQCERTLRKAIRASEDLQDMAGNPFFLTVMAQLHRLEKPLPDTGAALMDQLVDGILRDSRKADDPTQPRPIAADPAKLRSRLETIAFLHRERTATVEREGGKSLPVDIDLLENRLRLDPKWTDDDRAALIAALRDRAGILQSRDSEALEFHYRFEEFLAGCHLTNDALAEGKTFPKRVIETLEKQGDYARKTVLWAAGVQAHARKNMQHHVLALIAALMAKGDDLLAAEIARDARIATWDDEDVPTSKRTIADLRTKLLGIRDSAAPAKQRALAAAGIGILGDDRPGVGCTTVAKLELPAIEWCKVAAGKFPMGNDTAPYDDEKPRILFDIREDYRISRYPITVEQYAAFMAAGGYEAEALWTKAGWRWLRAERITGPERFDRIFQTPNHPRVGVSWYEATAFAAWLHTQRVALGLRDSDRIALPSEPQWERAARHTDAREYPWGKAALKDQANWHEVGIGHTSAVGLFPAGKAECGAEDMAGNVWEWCSTRWTDNYRDYQPDENPESDKAGVVRGGSWGLSSPVNLPRFVSLRRSSRQPCRRFRFSGGGGGCGVLVLGVLFTL